MRTILRTSVLRSPRRKMTTKAASKCGVLFSKIKTRDVPLSVMLDLFTCYVLPVYQYGLALHIGKYLENAMNAANAVFSKFLKRYLGIPYWSNNSITYFITGTQPLMTTLQQLGQKSINGLKFPHVLHGHKLSLVRNINTSVRYDPIQYIPNTFWMSKMFHALPSYARNRRLLCRDIYDLNHFDLCTNQMFHMSPRDDCICMTCGERAASYHQYSCNTF